MARMNLGPLARLVSFRLRRAQLAVFEDFQRDAPIQLPPNQFGILVIIDSNPEMTQQQLCDGIGVNKSTFAITLDRLADRGLIRRVRSEEDRRRNSLRIGARRGLDLRDHGPADGSAIALPNENQRSTHETSRRGSLTWFVNQALMAKSQMGLGAVEPTST